LASSIEVLEINAAEAPRMVEQPALPRRSTRYGVGKEIGGAVYLHLEYEQLLGTPLRVAKEQLPRGFRYTIVKYNGKTGAISFIQSPDFDTAPEPMVGDVWTISRQGRAHFRKQPSDPYIYHHKWLFVADSYRGFDVEESKARSWAWLSLGPVDRTRIGKQSYWVSVILPRLQVPERQ